MYEEQRVIRDLNLDLKVYSSGTTRPARWKTTFPTDARNSKEWYFITKVQASW